MSRPSQHTIRNCLICYGVITNGGYKYCGDECRLRASRVSHASVPCGECGNVFEKSCTHAKYCSSECLYAATKRRMLDKRRTDMQTRLNYKMSANVSRFLKQGKNGESWRVLVGYNAAMLLRHIKRKMLPGMTLENYGTVWHIDHAIPLAAFDFTDPHDLQFKQAWALDNLAPRFATTAIAESMGSDTEGNINKGCRILAPFQPALPLACEPKREGARRAKKLDKPADPPLSVVCSVCGAQFSTRRANQQTCSPPCRAEYVRRRQRREYADPVKRQRKREWRQRREADPAVRLRKAEYMRKYNKQRKGAGVRVLETI